MIKLIASDIDGTLVKDGTLAIDREYMEVIGRLLDKGIIFVACSGPQYRTERKLLAPVADRMLYISQGDSESGYSAGRNLERNVFYGKREYAFL